jgi:TRAP-type C4-dicarboxylate transport system substrate-binding protein
MNPAKFDALSDEHKKVLTDLGGVAGAKIFGKGWDDADAVGRKLAEEQDGVFSKLEGEELQRWDEKIAFMNDAWIEKANAAGLDGAALLEDLKATVAKYAN